MNHFFFNSGNAFAALTLRIILALIMMPHGLQKMFGCFGGFGFAATMKFFTANMRLPWVLSLVVILIEFLGPIGLLLGLGTRIWAIFFIAIMLGAIITTNFANGFFMNWFGNQRGEGIEYHLLVIGICLALVIIGSGKFGLDGLIKVSIMYSTP